MKIKHFILMKDHQQENIDWDYIRDNPQFPDFFIPFSKDAFIKLSESLLKIVPYKTIIEFCNDHQIGNVISLGSGRCTLEYGIMTNSDIKVTVTDTSKSIQRIKDFEIFDQVLQKNSLSADELEISEESLVILGRIDTEFDDENFTRLFQKLAQKNVRYVCFIPAELLDLKVFLVETKVRIESILKGKKKIFCGYARTKSHFEKCWGDYYSIISYNREANVFFLEKNKA